jgi:hypothetical protein
MSAIFYILIVLASIIQDPNISLAEKEATLQRAQSYLCGGDQPTIPKVDLPGKREVPINNTPTTTNSAGEVVPAPKPDPKPRCLRDDGRGCGTQTEA